jgi:hypothetical protein
MIKQLLGAIYKKIIKWWHKIWFEAKLKATLDTIEINNRIQAELELEKANQPIYKEHPIDSELQTGESQKLGGMIQLTAPWYTDGLQPPHSHGSTQASGLDDRM